MKVSEREKKIIDDVVFELRKAEEKHPIFPVEIVEMVAIMAEESGEAIQAANNFRWDGGAIEDVELELKHTAAMCIRSLAFIDFLKKQKK